jgi:allantoinase
MPVLARRNVPLLVHAEAPRLIRSAEPSSGGAAAYANYLATRPSTAEVEAVRLMVRLAEEFAVLTHIVHLSSSEAVELLGRAQAAGVPMTAETCPHYLTFSAEQIADGAVEFKCAPPVRGAADRDALWDALRRGVVGLVVSDHSPAPPELKTRGDFNRAWGGIASLELSLAVVWTGARRRGFGPGDLSRWMSAAPAALAGLAERKGAIASGRDADLVVWDPDGEFSVDPLTLQQRHKITPYAGMRLRGMVRKTFLRGRLVWDREPAADTMNGVAPPADVASTASGLLL